MDWNSTCNENTWIIGTLFGSNGIGGAGGCGNRGPGVNNSSRIWRASVCSRRTAALDPPRRI